jgi:hypothetical protein
MSRIIRVLKDCDECPFDGWCFEKLILNSNKGDLFYKFETILEENKENINFVWVDDDKCSNKYGEFLLTIPKEIYDKLCLGCLWRIISKYNDKPIGDKIYCFN